MSTIERTVAAVALAFTLAGCGSSSDNFTAPTTGNVVNASASLVFAPNTISIGAGESVTFSFGDIDHTVVFAIGATGAPQNIAASHRKNIVRTFNTPGTFTYICSLHSGMTGSVVVGGSTVQTGTGYYDKGGR